MNVQEQIKKYIASQPEPKRSDMQELHDIILQVRAIVPERKEERTHPPFSPGHHHNDRGTIR